MLVVTFDYRVSFRSRVIAWYFRTTRHDLIHRVLCAQHSLARATAVVVQGHFFTRVKDVTLS